MWPYAEIKRRCGSTKPHFLFTMAAVAPAATKLLVGFPSVSKTVMPACKRVVISTAELDAVVCMPENGPLIKGGLLFLSVHA